MHLSTCYVAGEQDGRVGEKLIPNYTPRGLPGFDAEQEWRSLQELVKQAEVQAESEEVTAGLRMQAQSKEHAAKDLQGAALENQIRKNRVRWLKTYLTEAGNEARQGIGLAEYLYAHQKSGRVADRQIWRGRSGCGGASGDCRNFGSKPFLGWNEGINTSASLSYLLGTYFRQLPSNESKRLDIIPVDAVCNGMTLIAAAVMERRHDAALSAGDFGDQSLRYGAVD